MLNFSEHPHRRYNILTGEWVLVSPHRTKRPWQGKVESLASTQRPAYDPSCYLCPGNERAGGLYNDQYADTYVFQNDFSAILPDTPLDTYTNGLLKAEADRGICKVICFSPNHSLTLADMTVAQIAKVVEVWQREFKLLGDQPKINYVQIFENKGEIMGCSNPHPHGQIWSQYRIPQEIVKKTKHQKAYFTKMNGSHTMLSHYIQQEQLLKDRLVFENEHFVVLIPFWAVWPYEAMIAPKRPMSNILEMTAAEAQAYAEAIQKLTAAYDRIFEVSFPYSAGIHQAPTDGKPHPEWHWHMPFYPPLLRSATVKKFMVGYEMLASAQRDITPEQAAAKLKSVVL